MGVPIWVGRGTLGSQVMLFDDPTLLALTPYFLRELQKPVLLLMKASSWFIDLFINIFLPSFTYHPPIHQVYIVLLYTSG